MSDSKQLTDWDQLAQSIQDEEAILVLGPDAIPFYQAHQVEGEPQDSTVSNSAESTFSKLSRQRVLELPKGQIQHYYQRDNLFQFRDATAKQAAMKCIREAARDRAWLPDSELLRQIVQMPFAVVLSLNPDKYLYEAFLQYWREPQFDYFTTKSKPVIPNVQFPTSTKPLLYNLCGSVQDKLDSVVLDYYDLFEFLKSLLQDHNIPEDLGNKLRAADRYILLGFDLERWYFQLFLHYINKLDNNPFNNFKQSFPILSHVGEASTDFVMRQFNIQHISASRSEFELLFEACRDKGILREIHDAASPVETQIRLLIVQGKFDEAFVLLAKHASEAERQLDIPHLQGRYNDLMNREQSGILSAAEASIERNRIRYALLTFANQLPKP
jgi:hypothetical protein